jgi:hypothetical protein
VKWEDVQGKTKAEFVSADGKEISGVATWGNQNEPVLVCQENGEPYNAVRIQDIGLGEISDNIQKIGYAVVKAPNGEEVFIVSEKMRQREGKPRRLDIAFSEKLVKDAEHVRGWFGQYPMYFTPVAMSGPYRGRWPTAINEFIIKNSTPNGVVLLKEFCRTGNFPDGMSDGWWVGTPQQGVK